MILEKEEVMQVNIEEALIFNELIKEAIKSNVPIRSALVKTVENVNEVIINCDKQKQLLFEQHANKDEKGNVKLLSQEDDGKLENVDFIDKNAFLEGFELLIKEKLDLTIFKVPSDKMVLYGNKEYKLVDYLEASVDIPSSVSMFLQEYFIYDNN